MLYFRAAPPFLLAVIPDFPADWRNQYVRLHGTGIIPDLDRHGRQPGIQYRIYPEQRDCLLAEQPLPVPRAAAAVALYTVLCILYS